jgi:hypothetical protein
VDHQLPSQVSDFNTCERQTLSNVRDYSTATLQTYLRRPLVWHTSLKFLYGVTMDMSIGHRNKKDIIELV